MKAIFEHWTVTLLGCLLVDKTWKSNLLSWACLRIYSAERGGVERQATSSYLSQIPTCFLRNEMGGGEATHTQTQTHRHTRPKGITVFPFLRHCLPASYFRGTLPAITLLSKRRSRENIRASPGLSAKLWTPGSQWTDTPALLPSPRTLTYTHNMFANDSTESMEVQALPLRQVPVFLRIIVGIAWLSIYALR